MDTEIIVQDMQSIGKIVDNLTLFDDDLMSLVFDNNIPAAELILKIILKQEHLEVVSVVGQKELENPLVEGRNIRLDMLVRDSTGKVYNVEVQRSSFGANEKRARFHSSMVDSRMLEAGQAFQELRESYVIFITEKDYFGCGLPIYTIRRHFGEIDRTFQDGSHILYVNGSYRGNDEVGRLMHDFACKEPEDIYYAELKKSVKHFKEEGGRKIMCQAVEEYAKEVATRAAIEAGIEYGIEKDRILTNTSVKFGITKAEAEGIYNLILKTE